MDKNLEKQKFQMTKNGLKEIADALKSKEQIVIQELNGQDTIVLKAKKGDKGDPGHTPTDDELIALIKPLIPEAKNGKDGKTPTDVELLKLIRPLIPEIKDIETPTDERLLELIRPLIPEVKVDEEAIAKKVSKYIKPTKELTVEDIVKMLQDYKKQWLSIEAILGDFNTKVTKNTVIQQLGTTSGIKSLTEGTGITLVPDGNGGYVVSATGSSSIYTETPSGIIDGVNKDYTVLHSISKVITFAINGMYIHRNEYTISGSIISFITPLDASLSGTEFDIVYS